MAGLRSGGCTVEVLDCGDSAVRVVVSGPSDSAAWRVAHGLAALLRQEPPAGLLGTLPTYDSVLVEFDCTRTDHAALRAAIGQQADRIDSVAARTPRTFNVPVAYGGEHGPDLDAVATHLGVTAAEVIALHTAEPLFIRCFGSPGGAPMMDGVPGSTRTIAPARSRFAKAVREFGWSRARSTPLFSDIT